MASGIVKTWFARCDIQISNAQILEDITKQYNIAVSEDVVNEWRLICDNIVNGN